LNDFGLASERQVESLRERVEASMQELETRSGLLDQSVNDRFEALEQRSQGFAMDLERHEADAGEALLRRSTALKDEIAGTSARLDEERHRA
jgi:VIT1/CCC1 family predicted Fe2+/Mn2+ transporter